MIKVHCHAQEYWYIEKQVCQCDGHFKSTSYTKDGTFVDMHIFY